MPRVLENGDRRVLETADINVRVVEIEAPGVSIATHVATNPAVERSTRW